MANHSMDDLDRAANATVGIIIAVVGGIVVGIGNMIKDGVKTSIKEKALNDIDSKIEGYEDKPFGKYRYKKEINDLKEQKREIKSKL